MILELVRRLDVGKKEKHYLQIDRQYWLSQIQEYNKMSLANRARQYKMFMERGEKELAAEQVEGHPELIEEEKPEAKSKKGK